MTHDDHRSRGRLAPPRPDNHWGAGVSRGRQTPPRRTDPPAEYWDSPPQQEEPYIAPEAHESYPYGGDERYPQRPTAPLYPDERRAATRVYPASEQVADDLRASDYGYAPVNIAPVNAGYYVDPPFVSPPPTGYDPEPESNMLTMQERYILLMRTIELHNDDWRPASIRSNEAKERLEAYLIPRNKRMELKEAIHRNRFMVITIDRLGNTTIKEPKREGPLRRLLRWLFGGD